ncbi:MAG: hypothetical protein D6695_00545 [Planctomycetota bacterium]|nr:MAG: hypothetical protein D6695_00545 [Planctomycetota bacterium]
MISLEPGLLVGQVVRGVRVVRSQQASLGVSDWSSVWENELESLDGALERLVARLGIPPQTEAQVICEAPDSMTEFQSISARQSEAITAARLAVAERMSMSVDSPCIAVHPLARAKGEDGRPMTQVIVTAIEETTLEHIYRWVERAGLCCGGCVPASAVMLERVAARLKADSSRDCLHVLHVGRCRSVVGSGSENGIQLLRTFEVGVAHLVEAVVRASQLAESGKATPLNFEKAQAILFESGLPTPEAEFGEGCGLEARTVLPLLQPVLQRISVEVKQSFRRVARSRRLSEIPITLTGPGALIERLGQCLSNMVDMEVHAAATRSEVVSAEETWVASSRSSLVLRTTRHEAERAGSQLRRAAIAGAIATSMLVGGQALLQTQTMGQLHAAIDAQSSTLAEVRAFRSLCEQASSTSQSIETARSIVADFVGEQPDWSAAITEVALAARDRVILTDLRADIESGRSAMLLSGTADASEKAEESPLSDFLESLRSSPFVEDVEVVSRRLIEIDDQALYQFRVNVELIGMRDSLVHGEVFP